MNINIGLGSDVAGGQTESIFSSIVDCVGVSKLYWRYIDNTSRSVTFKEAFYMATMGGGKFFGKAGSFEKGYKFDAVILNDSKLLHPQKLSIAERLERVVYLSLDITGGIVGKYVDGTRVI